MSRDTSAALRAYFEQVRREQGGEPAPTVESAPAVSPWMTTEELAAYLRMKTRDAARMWARRRHLTPVKAGRQLLYARFDVDVCLHKTRVGRRAA